MVYDYRYFDSKKEIVLLKSSELELFELAKDEFLIQASITREYRLAQLGERCVQSPVQISPKQFLCMKNYRKVCVAQFFK